MSIDSKLPAVGTTIFTIMSALAAEHDAINLSQGFPDFSVPEGLLERVTWHMRAGHNQYPPMSGAPELRNAVAAKVKRCYDRSVSAETEVTITSGATEALFCAIAAVVRSGDEVIIFEPAYDSYEPVVALQGGLIKRVNLCAPDFRPDWDEVRSLCTARTRLIIVNTPHNPTGSVWQREDMLQLEEVAARHDAFVLGDEVYEHMVFDGKRHESLLRFDGLYQRSFVVSSFGKTYHATGWKVGYCVAPAALTKEFRKVHQFVTFTTNTPMQRALADYMDATPEHDEQLPSFYAKKRDGFRDLLKNSRFDLLPCAGTYFQCADYSGISDDDDMSFVRYLTTEVGVAAIPLSVFYDPFAGADSAQRIRANQQRLVRFCFAKSDETLALAAQKLVAL